MSRISRSILNLLAVTPLILLIWYAAITLPGMVKSGHDDPHILVSPTWTYSVWYWNHKEQFQIIRFPSDDAGLHAVNLIIETDYPHHFLGCDYKERFIYFPMYNQSVFVRSLAVPPWMVLVGMLFFPVVWLAMKWRR